MGVGLTGRGRSPVSASNLQASRLNSWRFAIRLPVTPSPQAATRNVPPQSPRPPGRGQYVGIPGMQKPPQDPSPPPLRVPVIENHCTREVTISFRISENTPHRKIPRDPSARRAATAQQIARDPVSAKPSFPCRKNAPAPHQVLDRRAPGG